MLQSGGEEMFARNEHDHIIGAVAELRLVGLVAERINVGTHRRGMSGQADLALGLVDRPEGVLIGVQGDFRVHDQGATPGNADDDVGAQTALFAFDADLGLEVAILGQTAGFQHVSKLLLAPAPA